MDYVEFFCGNLHDSYKFRSIIHKVVSKDGYCSLTVVFREAFSCVFCTKIPSYTARNGAFAVSVHREACYCLQHAAFGGV